MQQKTCQLALALLSLIHIAGLAFCADSRRHLTQGVPQQPPFLPLPALNAQQQVYFPQWNQPGPQQSFAAAQQAQQQQLAQQQQQQQLAQQQQLPQQQQQNTNFDNLVKAATPSAGPVLAQAPGPAFGPSAALFSPLGAPVVQLASMQSDTCTEKASVLVGGACFDFVGPFRLDYDHLASLGTTAFEQAVALGPTPTNDCCIDAHAFVTEACACSARVASAAPALGMRPDAFKLVAKAAVMACPRYNIVDPCR